MSKIVEIQSKTVENYQKPDKTGPKKAEISLKKAKILLILPKKTAKNGRNGPKPSSASFIMLPGLLNF